MGFFLWSLCINFEEGEFDRDLVSEPFRVLTVSACFWRDGEKKLIERRLLLNFGRTLVGNLKIVDSFSKPINLLLEKDFLRRKFLLCSFFEVSWNWEASQRTQWRHSSCLGRSQSKVHLESIVSFERTIFVYLFSHGSRICLEKSYSEFLKLQSTTCFRVHLNVSVFIWAHFLVPSKVSI